ncbi:hypothetical protein D3C81_1053190 [compost metagenome]
MSISSSLQQLAGGVAASLAGVIIVQQTKESPLEHYPTLGIIVVLLSVLSIFMIYRVSRMIKRRRPIS